MLPTSITTARSALRAVASKTGHRSMKNRDLRMSIVMMIIFIILFALSFSA
ncbi:MAG: hypothetical protein P8X86_10875 [Desulfofustis sp.]